MAADLSAQLHRRGQRLTPQRELVFASLRQLRHATPEEVCAAVQQSAPAVNITTIYRTLELLEEMDLITHTHLGHGAPTYHTHDGAAHLHLICQQCGAVSSVGAQVAEPLVRALGDASGFVVDLGHLSVFGRCASCAGTHAQDATTSTADPCGAGTTPSSSC